MAADSTVIEHDADEWLKDFGKNNNYRKKRADLQKQTCEILIALQYTSENNKLMKIDNELLDKQQRDAKVYRNEDIKRIEMRKEEKEDKKNDNLKDNLSSLDNIYVMNNDCVDIGISLLNKGYNPLILNMANAKNPGGGWKSGPGAQEENLFRRTSFVNTLVNNKHLQTQNANANGNGNTNTKQQSKITNFFHNSSNNNNNNNNNSSKSNKKNEKSKNNKNNSKNNDNNNNNNKNMNDYKSRWYDGNIVKYGYPIDDFGCIYCPNLFAFRGNESKGYPLLDTMYEISFITAAMYAHPKIVLLSKIEKYHASFEQLNEFKSFMLTLNHSDDGNDGNDDNTTETKSNANQETDINTNDNNDKNDILDAIYCYKESKIINDVCEKIRSLLRVAYHEKHDSLVLSAWGCGAFKNPPLHQAFLFRKVFLECEFKNKFKIIVFAILDDHNAHRQHNPQGNFKPFCDVFGNKKLF